MTASNPSPIELASLQTKKIWEKVIGAKYNVNDEVNLIAQHWALINMGMAQMGPANRVKRKIGNNQ